MPRKFMFTKEEIVDAALEITREKGISAVTARSLVKGSGHPQSRCSVYLKI